MACQQQNMLTEVCKIMSYSALKLAVVIMKWFWYNIESDFAEHEAGAVKLKRGNVRNLITPT